MAFPGLNGTSDDDTVQGATTNAARVTAALATAVSVLLPVLLKAFGTIPSAHLGTFYIAMAIMISAAFLATALVFMSDLSARTQGTVAKLTVGNAAGSSPDHKPGAAATTSAGAKDSLTSVAVEPFTVTVAGQSGGLRVRLLLVDPAGPTVTHYFVQSDGCLPKWVPAADVGEAP